MMAAAQTTLTPEQKLEQAQRQLEEAKAALEQAKANAAKAKAEAEARAKKEAEAKAKADIEKKIAETKAEAERLTREAAALTEAAKKEQTTTVAPAIKTETTPTTPVTNTSSDTWVVPTAPATAATRANKNMNADSKANKDLYLQKGVVPEVNGQVMWSETINIPGATANELYDKAFAYLTALTQGINQLDGSKVALVNKGENGILIEWK